MDTYLKLDIIVFKAYAISHNQLSYITVSTYTRLPKNAWLSDQTCMAEVMLVIRN